VKGPRIKPRLFCCAAALILLSGCGGPDKLTRMLRQSPFALAVASSFNPADLHYLATLGNPNGGVRITFY